MTPSNECYDLIKQFEGLNLNAYLDGGGVPTIGFGSTMYKTGDKVKIGDHINQEQAQMLLEWEVDNKATVINQKLGDAPVKQNQFDALVSFAYNVGVGAFSSSTLLKKIKADTNDPAIRTEFMRWNKDNGKVVQGLTNRRQKEADFYFK